jgi:type VI secretion system protein ImpF
MARDCAEELTMASPEDRETRAQLSVLDRLLDNEPKNREEAPATRAATVRKARECLRRDLEWLLNTRAFPEEIEEELEQVSASVLTYGLPDFSAFSAASEQARGRLERALKRALELFEPRLYGVNVEASVAEKEDRGMLRILISGWFRMRPAPIEITFDGRLELGRGQYRFSGE